MTAENTLKPPYQVDEFSLTDPSFDLQKIANLFSLKPVEIVVDSADADCLIPEKSTLKKLNTQEDQLKFIENSTLSFLSEEDPPDGSSLTVNQKKNLLFYHIMTLNFGTERKFSFGAMAAKSIDPQDQTMNNIAQGSAHTPQFTEIMNKETGDNQAKANLQKSQLLIFLIKEKDKVFAAKIEESIKNILYKRYFPEMSDSLIKNPFENGKKGALSLYERIYDEEKKFSLSDLAELRSLIDFSSSIKVSHEIDFLSDTNDNDIKWEQVYKDAYQKALQEVDDAFTPCEAALTELQSKTTDANLKDNFENMGGLFAAFELKRLELDDFLLQTKKYVHLFNQEDKAEFDKKLKKLEDEIGSFKTQYQESTLPECERLASEKRIRGELSKPNAISFAITTLTDLDEKKKGNVDILVACLTNTSNLTLDKQNLHESIAKHTLDKLKAGCKKGEAILKGQYEDWIKEFKKMGLDRSVILETYEDGCAAIKAHFPEDQAKAAKAIDLYDKLKTFGTAKHNLQRAQSAEGLKDTVKYSRAALDHLNQHQESLSTDRSPVAAKAKKIFLAVANVFKQIVTLGYGATLYHRPEGVKKAEQAAQKINPGFGGKH